MVRSVRTRPDFGLQVSASSEVIEILPDAGFVPSGMVRVSLKLVARRGEVKDLTAALRSLMAQAQSGRGCVGCQLSADLADPDTLYCVEEWGAESDLTDQIRSDRFHRLVGVMEAAAECPRFEVQVVLRSRGLDFIETVFQGEVW